MDLPSAATSTVLIAPDLVGHGDLQTTKKHYIQAVGMKAHLRVQEVIADRGRAATARWRSRAHRGLPRREDRLLGDLERSLSPMPGIRVGFIPRRLV